MYENKTLRTTEAGTGERGEDENGKEILKDKTFYCKDKQQSY